MRRSDPPAAQDVHHCGPEAAREQDYGIEVIDLHLFYGCVPLELEAEVDQIVFVNWPKRIRLYSWGEINAVG